MIKEAKALVDLGLALIPKAPGSRRDLHGYRLADATALSSKVHEWWRAHPAANISVACGIVSGVCVLEVDTRQPYAMAGLAELESANGALPATWRSGVAGGYMQYWFQARYPMRRRRSDLFPLGLKLRADGESVIAPPSVTEAGVYEWHHSPWEVQLADTPQWVLRAADATGVIPRLLAGCVLSTDQACQLQDVGIATLNAKVDNLISLASHTGRHLALFQAAVELRTFTDPGLLPVPGVREALESAAQQCGLIEDVGRRSVRHIIESGLAGATCCPVLLF